MVKHNEKMKYLLRSLLLASLCAISSWSVSSAGELNVTQTPDNVSVTEGDDVNITCCWTSGKERVTLKWTKNQTVINVTVIFLNQSEMSNCTTLTISNITIEKTGKYICQVSVDIPDLKQSEGNGTAITVKVREITNDSTADKNIREGSFLPLSVIIASVVVVVLLVITFACFCTLRRSQAQAARVIYEVPHIDSEGPEMDKHSTCSSSGSSQWCQVPVYESFDYFERVQTKESR